MSSISYITWIKGLEIASFNDNKIILVAQSEMQKDALVARHSELIETTFNFITNKQCEISVITKTEDKVDTIPANTMENIDESINFSKTENYSNSFLDPKFTFDTFVIGNNNKFAHAAACAVAEDPAKIYNPLYIYGGVGLGKTHLMHAIGNQIIKNNPKMKILYVTSETFINDLVNSIKDPSFKNELFRNKYRNVDVLIVDDIQFIAGKKLGQEEFFHTFNALQSSGKQIIISSDKPPKEMTTLEERFRSRFQWGCMADIGSPDYETRMAILRRKEEMDNIKFDDEIIKYIATNIKSNIRELEGALNRLMAFSRLTNVEITIDTAIEQLESIINPDLHREVTPQLIIEIVAEHFQKTPQQLISKSRSSDIVRPRQIAMYLCKNMTGASLAGIGEILGGRDHSTIIHGIEKIEAEYKSSETMQNLIETIRKKINPN